MDRVVSDRAGVDVGPARALIVSSDPLRVDELARLCAAAALDVDVLPDPGGAGSRWARASCVLIGEECAAGVAALRLRRRGNVVLVGREPAAQDFWRQAVQIGAADVAVLPTDARRVSDRLADAASRGGERALVVGVVGAGGGAGASTVAASLAIAHARRGRRSLLVDADPLGGGIELVMGCEAAPGLRWPDIDIGDGWVAPSALLAALPSIDSVSVLSASSATAVEVDGVALRSMIAAGRRACGLVVVDLARRFDSPAFVAAAGESDIVLVVVASEVRSIAAARHVVAEVSCASPDTRAVVRSTARRRIEPDAVADALGLPLAGSVPTRRIVSRAADDGIGVVRGFGARRAYASLLAALPMVEAAS